MQVDTFFTLSDEFLKECKDIQIEKGREYTVDDGSGRVDKFQNFRSIGERLKLDPMIVMLVYMLKHMDSITTYALYKQEGSESIKGRCQDLVNYATMFWAMDHEDKAFAELLEDDYADDIVMDVVDCGYDLEDDELDPAMEEESKMRNLLFDKFMDENIDDDYIPTLVEKGIKEWKDKGKAHGDPVDDSHEKVVIPKGDMKTFHKVLKADEILR